MRFELCWVGRGYETIYLGNPSEASREIHLDKALASYSTFSLSCRELENPEKIVPSWIWEYQRKIGWSEMRCYPHNFLLNFFRGCQCNQCQTDSKKNWFSSNLICEQRRATYMKYSKDCIKISSPNVQTSDKKPFSLSPRNCWKTEQSKHPTLSLHRIWICWHNLWFL